MPPTLDPDAIASIRALGGDDGDAFLREIVEIFLADTPARLAELDDALRQADPPKFLRAAHSIKGSSANVGAASLRAAAEALENAARGGLAQVAPALEGLKSEYTRTREALEALLVQR